MKERFFAVLLVLAFLHVGHEARGAEAVSTFSLEEKVLFHYYVPREVQGGTCGDLSGQDLPKGSTFDPAAGLFTWLPDYGDAGSRTVRFTCGSGASAPVVADLRLEVSPAHNVILQADGPKVTLVGSASWAQTEHENDQKSLATLLGVYGLNAETVEDIGAAFDAGAVGKILVIPWHMAQQLSDAAISGVVAHVEAGGLLLTSGKTALSEALGIRYSGGAVTVTRFMDYLNPAMDLLWSKGEAVERFEVEDGDTVFEADRATGLPIAIGRRVGQGRVIYVGTQHYDHRTPYGTKGHPYLLYHFADYFHWRAQLSSGGLDAYFDPGNYDLTVVYVEDLIERWVQLGIKTVYLAAWHFWVDEDTGAKWEFGYAHFIEVCHRRGIRVYAWLAIPHVTQQFWVEHPECHEKTGADTDITDVITWRKAINLQNETCRNLALDFVAWLLAEYPWDGANLAEIYYEFLNLIPSWFTPMNADVREEWKDIAGYDPVTFFDPASPNYFVTPNEEWKRFLAYRTNLVTRLHDIFLERIFESMPSANTEVIVTFLDNLHDGYDGVPLWDVGVDSNAIVDFMGKYDFTLQVEDEKLYWSANPYRYGDFRQTYETTFPAITNAPDRLIFDFNVADEAHDPSMARVEPVQDYPSFKQTGTEVQLVVKNMFEGSSRAAVFSENTVEGEDLERVRWLTGAGSSLARPKQAQFDVGARSTLTLHPETTFRSVVLDGRPWPAWSAVDYRILVPPGSHSVELRQDVSYSGVRLADIGCELVAADVVNGGIEVRYRSPRQRAVLTLEAFDLTGPDQLAVIVDGRTIEASSIYPFYGHFHVFLPKGEHTVSVQQPAKTAVESSSESGSQGGQCFVQNLAPAPGGIRSGALLAMSFVAVCARLTLRARQRSS